MISISEPSILAFVFDLFFVSRIESVAKHLGVEVLFWDRVEGPPEGEILIPQLRTNLPNPNYRLSLILIDLSTPGLPWEPWLKTLTTAEETAQTPIVAFGSHVQVEILTRARAAGATEAIAKSRFTSKMPDILQKYL